MLKYSLEKKSLISGLRINFGFPIPLLLPKLVVKKATPESDGLEGVGHSGEDTT